MKNTDLSVKILIQKPYTEKMETWVLENKYKFVVPAYAAPNKVKAQQFYTDLDLYQQCQVL